MARNSTKYESLLERGRKLENVRNKRLELEYYNKNRGNIARGFANNWTTEDLKIALSKCKSFIVKGNNVTVIDIKYNERATISIDNALTYFQYWNNHITERLIVKDQYTYSWDLVGKINTNKKRIASGQASLFDIKAYEKEQRKEKKYWNKVKDNPHGGFKYLLIE